MRIGRGNKITLIKAEVRQLLEAKYMADQISRNVLQNGPDAAAHQAAVRVQADVMTLARAYGGQYLDEAGELKEAEHRKRDESEAPAGAVQ